MLSLVLASMKLGAPEVGKGIVEDWLTGRGDPEGVLEGGMGTRRLSSFIVSIFSEAFFDSEDLTSEFADDQISHAFLPNVLFHTAVLAL